MDRKSRCPLITRERSSLHTTPSTLRSTPEAGDASRDSSASLREGGRGRPESMAHEAR